MNTKKPLTLLCWNVNGLRAVLQKNLFHPVIEAISPDIICLQETKLSEDLPLETLALPDFPYIEFHQAQKKGYSGTAIFSKIKPNKVTREFPNPSSTHPQEGRVLTAFFDQFTLVNTYVPNSQDALKRIDYRIQNFDTDFRSYLQSLQGPVITCGDFNVAHNEIDLTNPNQNRKNAGFTDLERNSFSDLLNTGLIDTFRHLHPNETNQYTWWSFRTNARARNVGWRIDYFLLSEKNKNLLINASIHQEFLGSDHAPISIKLNL